MTTPPSVNGQERIMSLNATRHRAHPMPPSPHELAQVRASVIPWLMEGDPSIRWQVMRDLTGDPATRWRREQKKVATEGWGAGLLGAQRPDGNWGQGLYRPKWTCTTYTMQLLWKLGLPARHPGALDACRLYLDQGMEPSGVMNFWRPAKTGDTCVTAMVLGQLCWFGSKDARAAQVLEYLLHQQMDDGGWNCRRRAGAVHSSFHTTISVLEALHETSMARLPGASSTARAAQRGREFLLQHRLYRSSTDSSIPVPDMTRFHFPAHWHADVLRILDHFQAVDAPGDERLQDAMDLLVQRCMADGRWELAQPYPGARHIQMERGGQPSRFNTLRALRVLRWWERRRR